MLRRPHKIKMRQTRSVRRTAAWANTCTVIFSCFILFKMQSYRDFSEFGEMQSLSLYNNFYRDIATYIDHVSGYLEIYFLFGITCNNFILTYF